MTNTIESPLLSKEQLAILCKISVATVNLWISQKKITPIKIGRRCLFYPETVSQIMDARPVCCD